MMIDECHKFLNRFVFLHKLETFSGEIKINQGNFMSSSPIIIVMIIQYHKTGEAPRIFLKFEATKIFLNK
jgi:hypothetical protein